MAFKAAEETVMRALLCALSLCVGSGIAAAQIVVPDADDDLQSIVEAANKAWLGAYTAGDVDALVKMHSPDTVILSPNGFKLEGLEGARTYYTMSIGFAPKNRSVTIKESTVRQYGDIVIQNATWDFTAATPDDTPVEVSGRSSVVSIRKPDGWYIIDYHPAINPPPQN
jgi:uncharacterized protein (TIGR02246 family)